MRSRADANSVVWVARQDRLNAGAAP